MYLDIQDTLRKSTFLNLVLGWQLLRVPGYWNILHSFQNLYYDFEIKRTKILSWIFYLCMCTLTIERYICKTGQNKESLRSMLAKL